MKRECFILTNRSEMSDFGETSKFQETEHEIIVRHDQEDRELDEKIRMMLKAAKKSEKEVAQAKAIQMRFDQKARHREEMEELEDSEISVSCEQRTEKGIILAIEDVTSKEDMVKQMKIEKAKRKKEKKQEKEKEKEHLKAEIKASAGPSLRQVELTSLNSILAKDGLKVKEIISDGHCLYRAIADQLSFVQQQGEAETNGMASTLKFNDLRLIAANYLRENSDEFAPFVGFSSGSTEYERYCQSVESVSSAEWGGQVEIRVLANCLQKQIHIYDNQCPVIMMGEEFVGTPLKLTYHRHYFALGEHYNSVQLLARDP